MIKTKYTQQHLAKLLGISQPTIHTWLSGKKKPTGLYKVALKEKFPKLYEEIMNAEPKS